jgi:hypothetical protein
MKRLIVGISAMLLLFTLVAAEQSAPIRAPKGILRHTVAFNFKPGVAQLDIDKILADARTTLPTVKGAINIVIGPQTSDWTKYKYGISIDFVSKEAKANYATSAQSKRLHEEYKQYVEDEVVIDIVSE